MGVSFPANLPDFRKDPLFLQTNPVYELFGHFTGGVDA